MTNEELMIETLQEMKDRCNDTVHKVRYETRENALGMALQAIELMWHITDRPCEACEFKVDGNCVKWNCVFDEWLHEYVYGKRGAE